jgi:hypothetical protein
LYGRPITKGRLPRFFVNLFGTVNAFLADGQGVGTILND